MTGLTTGSFNIMLKMNPYYVLYIIMKSITYRNEVPVVTVTLQSHCKVHVVNKIISICCTELTV